MSDEKKCSWCIHHEYRNINDWEMEQCKKHNKLIVMECPSKMKPCEDFVEDE